MSEQTHMRTDEPGSLTSCHGAYGQRNKMSDIEIKNENRGFDLSPCFSPLLLQRPPYNSEQLEAELFIMTRESFQPLSPPPPAPSMAMQLCTVPDISSVLQSALRELCWPGCP